MCMVFFFFFFFCLLMHLNDYNKLCVVGILFLKKNRDVNIGAVRCGSLISKPAF